MIDYLSGTKFCLFLPLDWIHLLSTASLYMQTKQLVNNIMTNIHNKFIIIYFYEMFYPQTKTTSSLIVRSNLFWKPEAPTEIMATSHAQQSLLAWLISWQYLYFRKVSNPSSWNVLCLIYLHFGLGLMKGADLLPTPRPSIVTGLSESNFSRVFSKFIYWSFCKEG